MPPSEKMAVGGAWLRALRGALRSGAWLLSLALFGVRRVQGARGGVWRGARRLVAMTACRGLRYALAASQAQSNSLCSSLLLFLVPYVPLGPQLDL